MNIIAACLSFLLAPHTDTLNNISHLEMTTPEIQRIYFVRHGESELNQMRKIDKLKGQKENTLVGGKNLTIKLTAKGEEEAKYLGKLLKEKFAHGRKILVLSSTALRAQTTANLIFKELKEKELQVKLSDKSYEKLTEISRGKYEGTIRTEEYKKAEKNWDKKLSAQEKFFISHLPDEKEVESFSQVVDRAFEDLQCIIQEYPLETLIIVTHKLTLNALALKWSQRLEELSQKPGTKLPKLELKNGDMLMVEIPASAKIQQAQVKMHIQLGEL